MPENRRIIFAVPSYDCSMHMEAVGCLITAGRELNKAGIQWGLIYQGGSSIISKARNSLVDAFLEVENSTDLFFLDSDIVAKPDEILKLIAWGEMKDVVAGAYRIKSDEKTRYTVHPVMDGERIVFDPDNHRLMKITGVGAGFLLIKRHVFEKMDEVLDLETYADSERGEVTAYFHFGIENGQYVGEDIYFCHKAIEAGFDLWADPTITINHIGPKAYKGRLADEFHIEKEQKEVA